MRYPYDMWAHLIAIDNPYDYTTIPEARELWHLIWRNIFNFIGISSSDILLRAKIIHIVQSLISFGTVYLFSLVVIRNIYKKSDKLHHKYMAYWSTVIWFTIFSTFSMYYHHTWIMWYSISYQITLPLFWYITALTIIIYLENPSLKLKIFYILQILILSLFILQIHSMEYIYYILYLITLSTIYFNKSIYILKKYFYILIPILILIILFSKSYQAEDTRLLDFIYKAQFMDLYNLIIHEGNIIVNSLNRSTSAINELMYFILFMTILLLIFIKNNFIDTDKKILIFLIITSLFILIPLFSFSAGLSALLTKINVIHRIYYSSSLFILLPISVYYLVSRFKNPLYIFNISIITILLSITLYSKYISTSHNYYKNILSLKESIEGDKVRFNLSSSEIKLIGDKLHLYKNKYNNSLFFYARPDILVVLKYIYREDVYWRGRRATPSLEEFNKFCKINDIKNCVIFKTPINFPEYKPYL
ncbi:hypothetical protein MNB_SV-9-660 [hydrothermal vent metagenome]|uniref:Uncharacterized protein n=1 Tax=hydrothermal vent metagenome TaxID=652676 RepID=A0A1W1BK96_9ZZZZ